MKRMLPLAALLLAACKSREVSTSLPQGPEPEVGVKEAVFVAVDGNTGRRLAFVERWRYRSTSLHWVWDVDRAEKLGVVHADGRAKRYAWVMGQRSRVDDDLGVDTLEVGVRRILAVDAPVELVPTTERALADEMARKVRERREAGAAKPGEGGGGAGEGCGCGA